MLSRRDLLGSTWAMTGAAAAGLAAKPSEPGGRPSGRSDRRRVSRPDRVTFDDSTIRRMGGVGSICGMTWSPDNHQLLAVAEGGAWPGLGTDGFASSTLIEARGQPQHAVFHTVPGYPTKPMKDIYRPGGEPFYYGLSILSAGDKLFQYVNAAGEPVSLVEFQGSRYDLYYPTGRGGTKLIVSEDKGATWSNSDGTTPVRWESIADQSAGQWVFGDHNVFRWVVLLQMGKGYEANQDGYLYGYAQEKIGGVNGIALFRCPLEEVTHFDRYEFFAGWDAPGRPRWSRDIRLKASVLQMPPGWSCGSVVFNQPLGLYLMANACERLFDVYEELYLPSSLGFWAAQTPWGPWKLIHEEMRWLPGQDAKAWATRPIISPKWQSDDGRRLTLIWTDFQGTADHDPAIYRKWFTTSPEKFGHYCNEYARTHSNYILNLQNIKLNIDDIF